MSKQIYMGLPSDQRILAAVGTIAIRHGQLDYALRMMVKSLTGVSIGEALDATDREGAGDLRDRIKALARKRFGQTPVLVRVQAVITRAGRATSRRNELLHGLWAKELDGPDVMGDPRVGFADAPSLEQLNGVADEIYEIARTLNHERLDGFIHEALQK
jgi:hypothetical protein